MKLIEWFTLDDECKSVGSFETEANYHGDYYCPKCGKLATYWEGMIDQDRMGNDIEGCSYDCWDCHITTGALPI